jgi:hypothetical protein
MGGFSGFGPGFLPGGNKLQGGGIVGGAQQGRGSFIDQLTQGRGGFIPEGLGQFDPGPIAPHSGPIPDSGPGGVFGPGLPPGHPGFGGGKPRQPGGFSGGVGAGGGFADILKRLFKGGQGGFSNPFQPQGANPFLTGAGAPETLSFDQAQADVAVQQQQIQNLLPQFQANTAPGGAPSAGPRRGLLGSEREREARGRGFRRS